MIYLSLLGLAFIAATLLPASSELALSGLVVKQQGELVWLWLAATMGNLLGSCVNYYLGWFIAKWRDKRWFPVSQQQYDKACGLFNRYGKFSLLFAWLPIVGDPLTVVAGSLRTSFGWFFVLVALGKGARYALVIYLALQVIS
ncbi:YqaA family protein [Pseudoalteromonas maricaloris]|uniref:YqaA family protein n=1 Tax=Pseudoalteromonas maricaloris TaxID=184924 RepID=UPI00029A4883|nr:YqaA family protein [Pseudoalteromonas flavipulchra]